ncbi:hypothetical protein [Variovorax sp. 350MFTsu5.1]|uniref:hypothetical protein n=1 Tax=Variovorax sp. 350MFTsu5.1 TaxID=3158365 RepID=UPI003AABAEE2
MSIKHQFAAAIFAAAAFATSTAANAINPGDEVVVGVGTYDDSCESWIAARVAPQGHAHKADQYLITSWVQGYLSGANMESMFIDLKKATALPSVAGISAWLDKTCQSEPHIPIVLLMDKLLKDVRSAAVR